MLGLVPELNELELCIFLDLLSTLEFLPLFFGNLPLQAAISDRIIKFRKRPKLNNLPVFFFRRLLKINVTEKQIEDVLTAVRPLQGYIREYSFQRHIHPFALSYIIAGDSNFMRERNSARDFPAVDDVVKYCALFDLYLNGFEAIGSLPKNLIYYINRFKKWYPAKPRIKAVLSRLWAYIFYYSKANRTDYLQLTKMLTIDFESFIFLTNLNKIDGLYFTKIVTEAELEPHENTLKKVKIDYSVYIDTCFLLSGMFSQINAEKCLFYIREAFINSKLRHGWRKDIFISDFFNESFAKVLEKNWLTREEVLELSESIFLLNLRLFEVTDGDHTRYGILNFLDALGGYDVKLAYKYWKRFQKLDLENHVENLSLIAIIIHDIKANAIPYDKVQEMVNRWSFKNKEYTQSLFKVEMEILKSDFYDDDVKKKCFSKVCGIVESVKGKFDYQQGVIENYYDAYDSYCQMNKKENEIIVDADDNLADRKITQMEFSQIIDKISDKKELQEVYSLFSNRNNKIYIEDKEIWRKWIDKILFVDGNIDMFVQLTKEQGFLKTGFWETHNSEYFYLGVACCLENPNAKEQMEKCLIENAGYGAFYKLIYVFAAMNDKKSTLALFKKFYKFCDFLVN
ncbi:hypothetical protein [Chryseobacterium pennae]|uniref:hypothetical protein n=1 Tax=Chryseobacterium pennae TaxID=2258962 RepID=UPI000F4FB234|nr:hypothetical protein [Chryseobacterium pennae]